MSFLWISDRKVFSWCLYDVGNSGFATTVMAAVYPVYFREVAAQGLAPNLPAAYWGYASAIALLASAFFTPILGAVADMRGSKKQFLFLFTVLGVLSTAAMAAVGPGDWFSALLFMVGGTIGFSGAIVFYDALLPSLVPSDKVDTVSSQGFALGYLGGGVLLAINLLMIRSIPGTMGARLSFLSVALWWCLFSLPILFTVDEPITRARPEGHTGPLFIEGLRRLVSTFRDIRSYRDLFVFLLAFWLYNDGIGTIIRMAAIYGSSLGIPMAQLVGALLATQFVAFPFSIAFGAMAGRTGSKRAILIGLYFYIVITFASLFVSRTWHFWVLAIAVGMVQGGVQAISRSFFASMIPRGREAEFFGFYDISSKFSGIVGPLVFGFVTQLFGSSRLAIAILSYTFILGIVILRRVGKEKRP